MAEGPTARADDPILVCLSRRDAPLAKRQGRSVGNSLGYGGRLRTADRIRSPRTTAEEILAAIVAELVGRSHVGIYDNLFELGVDSIVGIQIVSRARQASLALEATHLFRYPTIAELAIAAETIDEPGESTQSSTRNVAPFELIPSGIDRDAIERSFAGGGGIEDAYPLTPVQEGMLFHTLVDPDAGNYLEQFLCQVRGELDLEALRESWQQLVARHPALRTTIQWTEFDQPYQVVHRRAEHPVDYQDLRALTLSQQEERLTDYLASDRRRSFPSDQPPLSRLALLRIGEDVYQLVWSIHHVVIDGWCLSLLLHEVLDIYEAIRHGSEPKLRQSRPFRDYVAWLTRRDEKRAESYWRQTLSGMTVPTPLGLEGLESNGRSSREPSSERHLRLPAAVTTALQAVARSHQLTLSTLVQGAWSLLLSRYSGAGEVLFGVTVLGPASRAARRGVNGGDVHQRLAAARHGDRVVVLDPVAPRAPGRCGRAPPF